jgi:acyl dehydratase
VERTPSDKQVVGHTLEPLEFTVTPEMNEQYLYGQEDYHPRYVERTPAGLPLVHPALLLNMSNMPRSPSFSVSPGLAAIHVGEQCEFLRPVRVGQPIKVTWVVRDAYEKRGRPYRVYDALITHAAGEPIMRRRIENTYVSAAMSIAEKGSDR